MKCCVSLSSIIDCTIAPVVGWSFLQAKRRTGREKVLQGKHSPQREFLSFSYCTRQGEKGLKECLLCFTQVSNPIKKTKH